jgi:uncharacterized protein (DUF4415 family)
MTQMLRPNWMQIFFENATILEPEVTAWFKDRYGKRYQVYMMAALREYMETHAV